MPLAQVTSWHSGTQPAGSTHFCPVGHFTFALQNPTQLPLGSHCCPGGHVLPLQAGGMHTFESPESHTVPCSSTQPASPAKQLHGAWHLPSWQKCPGGPS